jgi:hypothetical protein
LGARADAGDRSFRGLSELGSGPSHVRHAPKAEVKSEYWHLLRWVLRVDGAALHVIQTPKLEPLIMRYELGDFKWAAIKPKLPNALRCISRANELTSPSGGRVRRSTSH